MAKKVAPPAAAISQQDKEHLKSLFAEFLSHKEYRELEHGWLYENAMMIGLCAAYGKFDFSVVLEHFSDLMSALKFHGTPKEFMSWDKFVIHYAAYCLLDCPLLDLTVGASNDFDFMEKQLKELLFVSYYYTHKNKTSVLKPVDLPDSLQSAFDKDDSSALLGKIGGEKQGEKLIADITYAALLNEKWNIFAALHTKYDLAKSVDMEKIFEFWCNDLLSNWIHHSLGSDTPFNFLGQWREPEKYPLHRMMIEYGQERCVPALWRQGFLTSEIIEYLWNRGISFDAPLTPFYGWEKVSVAAFAACFGDLADKIELIPVPKRPSRGDLIFRQNVKMAAFFNEFSAKHPRKAPEVKKAPAVKKSKGELTDEQKARLANDEAAEVVFSKNKKTLVQYATCLGEREEWIQSGYPVPDFVTAIGVEAFAKVEGIQVKKVILPEGLTKIGRRAFEYCEIETVVFPSTLKTIEDEAFQFCNLKELHLLEGTEHIGQDAFCCCRDLQSAFLPDSLTEMGTRVFGNCDKLTELRLSSNLKSIPHSAFDGCKNLTKVFIPDGVEKIEDYAFRCCPELCMVEVPEGIEVCGNAFQDSPKVKIVYRPVQKKKKVREKMKEALSVSDTEKSYNRLTLKDLKFVCFDARTHDPDFFPFVKYGSTIDSDQWSNILLAYPHLIEVCDKKILKEEHWRKILREQPQLADHCLEKKWTEGIVFWKDDYQLPKKQNSNDMVLDLIFHPVHAEFCKWEKLSAENWYRLLLFHPEFISRCDISCFAPKMLLPDDLLQLQPQWGKYFEIEKLFDPGKFLKKNPEYEKNCKWENIRHQTWINIMESNPALLKYCNIRKYPIVTKKIHHGTFHCALAILNSAWSNTSPQFGSQINKTVHEEICRIIRENPVYLEKWNAYVASLDQDSLPSMHKLGYFLDEYFELYPLCDKKWLTSLDWGHLISLHSELIHDVDLEILTSDAWCKILMLNPTLAECCNAWEDFSAKQWLRLLWAHPEFFPKCPPKNYKKWNTAFDWKKLIKAGCPVKNLIPEKLKAEVKRIKTKDLTPF